MTKTEVLKSIRKKCLECTSNSAIDIENCTSGPDASPYSSCALWMYRFGKDVSASEARKISGKMMSKKKAD